MPTLHKTVEETKLLSKWLAGSLAALFLLIILFKIGTAIKEKLFPTPLPPPTVAFGKLPAIAFPPQQKTTLTYNINTISGVLPGLPDRAVVYKISQPQPSLLSLSRAQDKVLAVGFTGQGVANGNPLYIWTSSSDINRKLSFNILTYNFDMTSDYLTNSAITQNPSIPNTGIAVDGASKFLSNLAYFPTDIDSTKTTITPFSVINGVLTKTTSLSKAQLLRVDFFQRDISKIPVVYSNSPFSSMNFLVSQQGGVPEVVEAHFFYQPITEVFATYPILTPDAAYNELQNGQAYIASFDAIGQKVAIDNLYLGYFAPAKDQLYLMPVVVFEGDHNFKAYVPAITTNWIQ